MTRTASAVILGEVDALANDLTELMEQVWPQAIGLLAEGEWRNCQQVWLVGNGDSYHAAQAASLAFNTLGELPVAATGALPFSLYRSDWQPGASSGRALVVAISRSGETPLVCRALTEARSAGAHTIAITGTPDSTASQLADRTLLVPRPNVGRSPGVRSYQASLLGLLLLAIAAGHARGTYDRHQTARLRGELTDLSEVVAATVRGLAEPCQRLAGTLTKMPVLMLTGAGPHYGTAGYGAAKLIETCGMPAWAQDLEEWWHVERFLHPSHAPLLLVAPPGRSHSSAVTLARRAARIGRPVIAVANDKDTQLSEAAAAVLPVQGTPREEFAPLLYHLFAGSLAPRLADLWGRTPFLGGSVPVYRPEQVS